MNDFSTQTADCGYVYRLPEAPIESAPEANLAMGSILKAGVFGITNVLEGISARGTANPTAPPTKLLGTGTRFTSKIEKQLAQRGWSKRKVLDTIERPVHKSPSKNLANGNPATAYFDRQGAYVVRDDLTGEIIQVSNRHNLNWVPDKNILNPYQP